MPFLRAWKWDESEQILWAQSLALGYGPQPPLYTWMQWAICQVPGLSALALAVLKHLLIGLTYCLAWLAGRQLLNEKGAWWVAGGLLLMPPFGWDSTELKSLVALGGFCSRPFQIYRQRSEVRLPGVTSTRTTGAGIDRVTR